MKTKINKEKMLENLRLGFRFYASGVPDLYSFGDFKSGVTSEEIEQYLMVRTNSTNVKALVKKFNEAFGCQTCACITVKNIQVILYYRHDVMRCADDILANRKHYPLD